MRVRSLLPPATEVGPRRDDLAPLRAPDQLPVRETHEDPKFRHYPEARFGGFADVDQVTVFYTRVRALIEPSVHRPRHRLRPRQASRRPRPHQASAQDAE
jgi:hypothetical protein